MGYKKISKTKKGRSQDRKRISLTTKHERDYLKKIAKENIEFMETMLKNAKQEGCSDRSTTRFCKKILRISKGLLKFLEKEK